jgi:AraC-like DNA-binding protein
MLLSRNYPPSDALSPYIRRHYVFEAALPADFTLIDQLLSENAFVRILMKGDWQAEIAPGQWASAGPVVLFGANGHPFRVRVTGPFMVAGFAIRPSGWRSLFAEPASRYADEMLPLSAAWGEIADSLWDDVSKAADDAAIVAAMEAAVRAQLGVVGNGQYDAQMARFERVARLDSTVHVDNVASELGLSVRQFERRCLASFGLSPKAVLRRSRFLDMAAAMRGFSTPTEEQLAELRYFDQSHLNREFKRFTGLTPGKFREASTPLLTAGLKLRAEGDEFNWDGSGPPPHAGVLPLD